jgi:tagatose 1,6-diphosphate aldolase
MVTGVTDLYPHTSICREESPLTSPLTIGKMRGIQQAAFDDGLFSILAIDHRGPDLGLPDDSYEAVRDFKLSVVRPLIPHASAVLLDPVYSAAEAIAGGVLPGRMGLLVELEAHGYTHEPETRTCRVLSGWSLEKIKRMGASMAKLFFNYHPNAGAETEQQEAFVAGLVEQAREADLPLIVEPICFSLDPAAPKGSAAFAEQRPDIVIESVRRVGALGPDMLKVEFPHDAAHVDDESAWAESCAALDEASPVPWLLLSAGVDYDTFHRQLRVACEAGASGHVTGRAIWKEAGSLSGAERETFLHETAAARLAELTGIVREVGRPWTERCPDLAAGAAEGWYEAY